MSTFLGLSPLSPAHHTVLQKYTECKIKRRAPMTSFFLLNQLYTVEETWQFKILKEMQLCTWKDFNKTVYCNFCSLRLECQLHCTSERGLGLNGSCIESKPSVSSSDTFSSFLLLQDLLCSASMPWQLFLILKCCGQYTGGGVIYSDSVVSRFF